MMHIADASGASWFESIRGEFFSALFGALFGAGVAYVVQLWTEKERERNSNHAALVRAQFALTAQLNELRMIDRDLLEEFRNDKDRARKMLRFTTGPTDVRIDIGALAFLLHGKDADLVNRIYLAEWSYRNALAMLADRNLAYDRLHANSEVVSMDDAGNAKLKTNDPRHLKYLDDTTDNLFETVPSAIRNLEKVFADLRRVGKSVFEDRPILEMKMKPYGEAAKGTGENNKAESEGRGIV